MIKRLFILGMLFAFLSQSRLPFAKNVLHMPTQEYQRFGTIAMTPWSMKAFIGCVSDTVWAENMKCLYNFSTLRIKKYPSPLTISKGASLGLSQEKLYRSRGVL